MWSKLPPDMIYAFTMGLHERLGSGSPVRLLTADIIERVISRMVLWSSGSIRAIEGGVADLQGYFGCPHFLAVDQDGNIVVLDDSEETLQTFSPAGELLRTMEYDSQALQVPQGILVHGDQIFTCDWGLNYLVGFAAFSPNRKLNQVSSQYQQVLLYPSSVALTSDNEFVLADSGHSRVLVSGGGGSVRSIAHEEFLEPMSVALDKDDNIYVADRAETTSQREEGKVMVMSLSGKLLRSSTRWFDREAQVWHPFGHQLQIALDPEGNIFVSDYINETVMCLNPHFEGRGYTEFDGCAFKPLGLVCDAAGNLLVADERQARVLMIPYSFFR